MEFKIQRMLSLLILLASAEVAPKTEFDLHVDLFNNKINPLVLPVRNPNDTVHVFTELTLQTIEDLDEKRQTFSVTGYLELTWKNEYLVWDPKNYSGVQEIVAKCEDMWLPELQVANIIGDPLDLRQKNKHALLASDGEASYWLYKTFTVACEISIRFFPFDAQSCEIELQSWWYQSSKLNLTFNPDEEVINFSLFRKSTEWHLESSSYERVESPPGWVHVKFIFNVRRRYLFHVVNLVLPLVCISFLNLMVFVLPAESGEKITLCISVFLTLAVFLTIITSSFPESSDEVSLLSIYVTIQLMYSGVTICTTVMSLHLYYRSTKCRVSWAYRQLCRLTCDKTGLNGTGCRETEEDDENVNPKHTSNKEMTPIVHDVYWVSVSRAFDKLCLFLSIFWNILLTLILIMTFLK